MKFNLSLKTTNIFALIAIFSILTSCSSNLEKQTESLSAVESKNIQLESKQQLDSVSMLGSQSLIGHYYVQATWRVSEGSVIAHGIGTTKVGALDAAREHCRRQVLIRDWKYYCSNNPSGAEYTLVENNTCIPRINLHATGYPGSGHKTNWCKRRGYDGYDPTGEDNPHRGADNGHCFKSCPENN